MSGPAIYISGPMTGLPDLNYQAFAQCAKQLRATGWEVVNPAEHFGGAQDLPRHKFLAADVLALVQKCWGVVLLPGWHESEGAKLEAQIALDLGYEFNLWHPLWTQPDNWYLNMFVVSNEDIERALA